METAVSAIQVTQSQQFAIQSAAVNAAQIQIFAQDPSNHGKAIYIIDPNQAGGGLQMISNADQRFVEYSSSAVPSANLSAATAVMVYINYLLLFVLPCIGFLIVSALIKLHA